MSWGPCRAEQKASRSVSLRCTLNCVERVKSFPGEGRDVERVTEMMRVTFDVQSGLLKLAREIDDVSDIGQTTAECQ